MLSKSKTNKAVFVISFLLLILSLSCNNARIFEENKRIDESTWNKFDTLQFFVNIEDTLSAYDIYFTVRNSNDYPFNNMFVFIKTTAPSSNFIKDTLEVTLADNSGEWIGKGIGDVNEINRIYKKNVRFALPGIYTIEYVQGMRMDNLPGVLDVGLRIENTN